MARQLSILRRPYYNYDLNHDLPLFQDEVSNHVLRCHDDVIFSSVKCDRNKFQVNLDVWGFQPDEINVKTKGKFLVVEGNHEVMQKGLSFISHHFENRYFLPDNAIQKMLQYNISLGGILQVEIPRSGPWGNKSTTNMLFKVYFGRIKNIKLNMRWSCLLWTCSTL